MMEYILTYSCSALFAITMKIADALDEHGKHFFKGDDIFFGLACSFFGCILIIENAIIAHVIIAMIIGYIFRGRVDYPNHRIAFSILFSCFMIFVPFDVTIYFFFLVSFCILGMIKDLKYKKTDCKVIIYINKIYRFVPIIYTIPTFIYSIYFDDWLVFFSFIIYDVSYNITRLLSERNISHHSSTLQQS